MSAIETFLDDHPDFPIQLRNMFLDYLMCYERIGMRYDFKELVHGFSDLFELLDRREGTDKKKRS